MNYLLEIGTEELPARLIRGLTTDLRDQILDRLREAGLAPEGEVELFCTPRRLAILLRDLPDGQPDRTEEITGPPAHVAFDDDGNPTKAAEGFARKQGGDPSQLRRIETDKGAYAALTVEVKGKDLQEVLAVAVPESVSSLYLAASMRWGRGQGPFVRAVRWIVSVLDDRVLPLELFGLAAGNETRGHRVLGPGPHAIVNCAEYVGTLRANGVEPDPDVRRKTILEQLSALSREAGAPEGQEFSEKLVDEQVMLNEHPVVVLGEFDGRFLSVPREIIDTSMRYHQKMFSLRGDGGALLPRFLTVLNMDDPNGQIVKGQRQVLEARLHDADFFWHKDLERKLPSFATELSRVVFQERLGSYQDKVDRMKAVLAALPKELGFEDAAARESLEKSLDLCKADLCSLTVGEFPELQGIVGALLSREEGDPREVRCPIRFQYAPFEYPREDDTLRWVHTLVLLDQLDTLMGCHGVGVKASGSKDPYGLRRAAYTAARVLCDGHAASGIGIVDLLSTVRRTFKEIEGFNGETAVQQTMQLLEARLRFYVQDELSFPYDEVNAVLASGWHRVSEVRPRLAAVREVRQAGALEGLAVPFKRIRNILRKAEEEQWGDPNPDPALLSESAETDLSAQVDALPAQVTPLLESGDYLGALRKMTSLREQVDRFFDEVLVMADDPNLRATRLGLLVRVRDLFLQVVDPGEIVESGSSDTPGA